MGGLITIATALVKAYIDYKRWPFENHWVGFVVAAAIVLYVCWYTCEIYPVFLYNMVFNPALNLMKGQPFFYIGETAATDKLLKKHFGYYAGQVWIGMNAILLMIAI